MVTLALAAARKAEDDELAKTATMCVLEPETKPVRIESLWISDKAARLTNHLRTDCPPESQLPAPDAAAQEQALKLVREVLKDKYSSATTSERQKALSRELLQKVQATKDDAAAQYVMLKEAGRYAIKAKDADLVFQVIEEWGAVRGRYLRSEDQGADGDLQVQRAAARRHMRWWAVCWL